ncbi:ribonuclease H-like domain-containing protein [Tanacetum coccineum]|uniref:Ribonuclease H-like domain-containing protein n=1 Tax=Tanacetum coccineum TaxID=301880 RepID=A0ABQ5I419_9ASTR
MSEPMPSIPTQSTFTYPNPNSSASPSFTQDDTSDSFIPEPTQPIPAFTQTAFSQPGFSQPNQSIFSQPAVHFQQTQPTQTNQTGQQYPNNVQSQQFQTASISANNAKFPYLEKDKYEIWAMKMSTRIQNADINLWRIVHKRNIQRGCEKNAKGNTIVHPPVSLDEHVAVQRENKVRTLLLQALPEDHMPDFHHYDDARDIWMAVKARFGGNEESKKMRKTILNSSLQNFCGQKRRPTKGYTAASSGSKLNYSNQQSIVPSVSQISGRSDSIMECVLHSFVAENEPDQDMIYEDFDQKKAGRKMNYNNQQPARFDRRKVRCYKCLQLGHFARECNVKTVDDKARYSAFKVTEVKTDEPKALVSVDSMVNCGAGVSDATAEFAMMGISPKAQKEKKEWEVKFEATLARFEKWKESSKNLKKLINSSMSTRTKIGLGFKEYFGKDEVFDFSSTITGTYMPTPYKSDIEETQPQDQDQRLPTVPTKTAAIAKTAIQEMAEYSQKWHNGTSRGRSIENSDGLAAIQAQLNHLGREIKKVNAKVYAAQERGFRSLPSSTETNPRDQVKSISTSIKADSNLIRRIRSNQYAVSTRQNSTPIYKARQTTFTFPSHLDNHYCEEERNYGPKFTKACGASHINNAIPQKEKDLGRASISVMPLSTYLNLGLGELVHTRLTVELADRTAKYPKGIAENVLVGIGNFTFPIDFIILDIPEDIKVPLILERPFLSTARAKIDVYKRKFTLRVGEEKIIFKSVKPASSIIMRVYMLSLRERMELD